MRARIPASSISIPASYAGQADSARSSAGLCARRGRLGCARTMRNPVANASAKTGGDYVEGLIAESAFYEPFGELLEKYDALICPTTANTGFAADEPCTDSENVFGQLMTLPFNIVGRAPVLAVPSGKASNGVPTGVQIVGRTFDDQTVFTIGAAVEAELALWTAADWWPSVA